MNISLIQCPVWGTYDPPLALAQLSSCLKKEGHKVSVHDLNIRLYLKRADSYKNSWAWEQSLFWYDEKSVDKFFSDNKSTIDQCLHEIINTKTKAVGFSVSAASKLFSLKFARMIKDIDKDIVIIFGGPIFFENRFVGEILKEEFVDIIIPGEGEVTLVELARFIQEKKDINKCPGICFRYKERIIDTSPRETIENLDRLPFLDFSDLPLSNYDDSRHLVFMAGRGCTQRCVFCSSRAFWPGYRAMSGERIFREIEFHKKKLGSINPDLRHVDFLDLMFNGNMKYLIQFCDLMIESKLDIFWSANMIIRPEMSSEVIKKLKDSGCEHVIFGIESGSQHVLDLMKKHYRIEDADRIIKSMREAGIRVTANFMFGFPGETEEDFAKTLDFIRRNASYLSRVYPSRTFCAIEEFSYLAKNLEEFNIKPNPPNHLYWESLDGKNIYPERLKRCEEFCNLALSLGIEVGCGVQTSTELDRWFNLGYYYECKGDLEKAIGSFLEYREIDPKNAVISDKVKYYVREAANNNINLPLELKMKLEDSSQLSSEGQYCNTALLVHESAPAQRRFTWNIHYDCNYRCPYCFFNGKWVEYKKRNVYLSVDEWMVYWNKIHEKYGRCYILVTGGEPFIYPNFIELMTRLSEVHYPINISTNTSGDLESFVKRIDPERVSLSVSLQLNFERLDAFLEKVKFLRKHRFEGCINFVAYPPFVKHIALYAERFNAIGERLKVIPFWGKYQDKEYPFAYTQEEKEIIGIDDSWINNVRKKNSLCPAGYNSALIFPDGKVARCGQIGERVLLGNFFDYEFKLLSEPLPCDAEYCPCDENKLFGEEKEPSKEESGIIVDNSKEQEIDKKIEDKPLDNSSLNNEEYNAGKIVLESSPKSIFIQAAGPCNSNCVFCSRQSQYEFFDLEAHNRRFEKNLYPFITKAETLILTGSGEFLSLPEAGDILDFFDQRFPHVEKCFSTNGSSLVPWACERIAASKSRYTIHVSLHASNPILHKVMTRTDNFDKIVEQIKYILKLRRDKDSLHLNLIFVATTLNIEDLPNFIRLASSLNADKVICYYNYIYIPTQKYLSCFFKQEITNRILNEAQELAHKLNIEIALPPKFGQKDYPRLGPCREAFSQIMFDYQGHVLPCDASEDCGEILGNGKNFMDVWNSSYYQNLRKSLLNGNSSCFKHCLRANPSSVNDFKSHVICRGGRQDEDIHILWADNF